MRQSRSERSEFSIALEMAFRWSSAVLIDTEASAAAAASTVRPGLRHPDHLRTFVQPEGKCGSDYRNIDQLASEGLLMFTSRHRPKSKPACRKVAVAEALLEVRDVAADRSGKIGDPADREEYLPRLIVAAEPEQDEGVVELHLDELGAGAQDPLEDRRGLRGSVPGPGGSGGRWDRQPEHRAPRAGPARGRRPR